MKNENKTLATYTDISQDPIDIIVCPECKRPTVKGSENLTDTEGTEAYLRFFAARIKKEKKEIHGLSA